MSAALLAAGFAACTLLALATWAASLPLRDASIVDIAWGWMVTAPGVVAALLATPGPRAWPVLAIAIAWAARLSLYIASRHRGEDWRYQAIRARNEPHFGWKSVYLVFGLQAVLAWLVSAPLVAAFASARPWHALDTLGVALALAGLAFEAVADAQLARFRADAANRDRVMDRGLWRYSRHPNYFGEFCVWWGLGLVGVAAGAWWVLVSPIVMSVLLLKVSGVTLLERDLPHRRPGYREYVRRTSAFFPWSPRA